MSRTLCRQFAHLIVAASLAAAFLQPARAQVATPFYLDLDGLNDYLSVPDADSLSFGTGLADTPLTFETWFKPDSMTVKQNLVSKWTSGPNQEYKLHIASGTIRLDLQDTSTLATVSAYTTNSQISLVGSWHHLAATYDGRGGPNAAGGITLYVDGVAIPITRINNPSYVAMENRTSALQIGRESSGFRQYDGSIDELRIWNVARTQTEIQAHMAFELTAGPQPGLVAYWRFNEGSGDTVADGSLGGHTATMFNSPVWVPGGPVGPSDPDVTPPEISNVAANNITDSGVTITFSTNEITTGWVSLTQDGSCPCTDVFSPASGVTHTVTVTGLVPDTAYAFVAKATDAAGNLQTGASMNFRTLVPQPDTTAPTVSITHPVAGTVSGTVTVEAAAADAVGVAGVQFKLDGAFLGLEDVTPPYSIPWDTLTVGDGPHTLTADARDAANNVGTFSVVVTVSNSPVTGTPYYLDLDGVDDYLAVSDVDSLSFGDGIADRPLTFEVWIKPDSMTARQNIVSKWLNGPNQEYRLYISTNFLRLDLQDSSTQATISAYSTNSLAALVGSWHHLAATYDGRGGPTAADGITLYVDGVAVALTRFNNPSYVSMENRIAALQIGRETSSSRQYDGGIDELRIWNVARTQNQIQTHRAIELNGAAEPGMAAYWKFNEGSGTTAADDSLGGLTATLNNNPTWISGGPIAPTVDQAPAITSAASASFPIGAAGSFTVTATGFPVPTLALSGTLPTGVTFTDNGNGTATLAGTPAAGSAGVHPLTFTATNGVGAPATQAFTLTVGQTVAITSAASATFPIGVAGNFTVTATGFPAPTLAFTGSLPAGVTFTGNANGTATLAGTPAPASAGAYPLTFTATSGAGAPATQSFTLTVSQPAAITSAASATFPIGVAGSFTVTATGFPLPTLASVGALPAGVTFTGHTNGTATLAGTPAPGSGGAYPLSFTASNGAGAPATQTFTLTVTQPAAITSAASASFPIAVASSFTMTSTGFPVPTLAASGALPPGVTISDNGNGTATLAGTPGSGGIYPLTVTATNGVGVPATQIFTLTVQACTLSPAAGSLAAGTFGIPYGVTFIASGGTSTFALTAGSLPGGLTLATNGTLTGTPTNTGTSAFTVTATNSTSCVASNAYSITVAPNAQNESFSNGVGNTQYSVGAGTPATPAVVVSGTVLSNDQGPGTLVAGPASIATANGGQVAMSTLGTFLYSPLAGFAGPSDSFTYTLTDGNGVTDTAVVTINLSGIVWYVSSAGGAGDGRSHNPFNTMTVASTAAQPGQYIYVHQGSPAGATTLKAGQTLWGAGAVFSVNGLIIGATTAPTLMGTVTLTDNVVVSSLSANGGAGAAIAANGLSGTEVLNAVSVVGGSTGLQLTNLAGTLTMSGGAITGVSGADVLVSGGTGLLTIGASITNTAGRSVDVQNRTAGTVTFSGAISDTGTGILLNANTGSAIAFTGGLTLSTGANAAFTATGGGILTVTQNNVTIVNTIATTTGTALNVTNTEIGAAGLTFRAISAGTAAFSAGNGIVLDNTGLAAQNAGLTITGNGIAQSGGLIRRKTGADGATTAGIGIYLNNTKDASFRWIELTRLDNSGIVGRNVAGFLLTNSVINGAGTTAGVNEGPLVFGLPASVNGLQGTGIIRDTLITGGFEDNVAFYSHTGTMTLQVDRSTGAGADCLIGTNSTTTGGRGMVLQIDGTATASATINQCRFMSNRTVGLLATAAGDSALTLLVTGSATVEQLRTQFLRGPAPGQGQDGIVVSNSGNADITATIEHVLVSGFAGAGVWVGQAPGNASALSMLRATITNNRIDSASTATTAGIVARFSSTVGEVSQARLLVADNVAPTGAGINQFGLLPAVAISTPDAGTTPAVDVTISGNHIDMRESAPNSGIRGPVGISVQSTQGNLCGNILSNISHWYPTGFNPQSGGIRAEQTASGIFRLERGSQPLGTSSAAVLAANNPAPAGTSMITEALGSFDVVQNAVCQLPSAP